MKHKIKVSSGFQGVIPTGSFQNSRPSFNAEVEFEVDTKEEVTLAVEVMQEELYRICRDKFDNVAEQEKIVKIKNDRKDFRFYLKDGQEYPSVTSILNYDSDFLIADDELKQYASQGNIIHAQVAEYITTGQWKNPKDIEGTTADLFILKTGSLQLSLDGWDFLAFLNKYPMEKLKNGEQVFNDKERYAGLPDGYGLYLGIPSIFDIKRTQEKTKNFMQMSAYAKASKEEVKQMIIIPLNDKTEQGFSKPIISSDIDKYFELFLYKRKEFKKVYGV
jgi:hypothetical protein